MVAHLSEMNGSDFRLTATRRELLRMFAGGAVFAAAGSSAVSAAEPDEWRTWLFESADALQPEAPPPPSQADIAELLELQSQRTAPIQDIVRRWGGGPTVRPWTEIALELLMTHKPTPVRAGRALALMHTATYDAVIASRDAHRVYSQPAPAEVDARVSPLDSDPDATTYPSEHAAVAGAAATVLAYLFPDESSEHLTALAGDAATSRLWAGAAFRRDVEAGLSLGRAIGELAVAYGKADGSDKAWDDNRLTGPGTWEPTPPNYVKSPLDPMAGSWQPWILESGDQLRPAAPPAYGTPAWTAELAAVREAVAQRTLAQEEAVERWAGSPGTVTPAGLWIEIARDLVERDQLDSPQAARVLALTSVAMYDAFICCWDAKYAFWTARPITADPTLDVQIPTPPFPSYTSGHSTISAAAATVLASLFPEDEAELTALAVEAKNSRLWAGIHYPIDNETGAMGGGLVGELVLEYARNDGAAYLAAVEHVGDDRHFPNCGDGSAAREEHPLANE